MKKLLFALKIRLAASLLLALSLLHCSMLPKALHRNPFVKKSFQKAPLSSRPLARKTSGEFQERGAASAFEYVAVLEEWHERFLKADYEIRRGMAQKDRTRVLFGLESLRLMLSGLHFQEPGDFQGPGKEKALAVLDRAYSLWEESRLTAFQGKPKREDYWRLAEDYKSFLDAASAYWTSTASKQNEIFRDFAERKSQIAGPPVALFVKGASMAVVIISTGVLGLIESRSMRAEHWREQRLYKAMGALKELIQRCLDRSDGSWRGQHSKVDSLWRLLGGSYAAAEEIFCGEAPKNREDFADIYHQRMFAEFFGYDSRRSAICKKIGAPEDCHLRKYFCANLKNLKDCI